MASEDTVEQFIDKVKEQVKASADDDKKQYDATIDEAKADVLENVLKPYMESFAGRDNVKMSDGSIMVAPVSDSAKDSNSKGLVDNTF